MVFNGRIEERISKRTGKSYTCLILELDKDNESMFLLKILSSRYIKKRLEKRKSKINMIYFV